MANTPYAAGSFSAASGGTLTPVVTLTADIASGDNVYVAILSGSATAPTLTDTQQTTYVLQSSEVVNADCSLYVFVALNGGGLDHTTDTILPTFPGAANQAILVVGDNGTNNLIDISVINAATTGVTASKATGTLALTEEHIIAFVGSLGTSNPSFGSPVNTAVGVVNTGNFRLAAAYEIVSATTTQTATATVTSAHWSIIVISTGAAPVTPTLDMSNGVQTEPYSQTLEASGGIAPYTWSIVGSLPTGLSLSSGVISGTPSVNGTFTFTTRATDAHGVTGDLSQTITIIPNGPAGAAVTTIPNNLISAVDSDFETGAGTWAADTNAGTPAQTTSVALTGTHSLKWASSADGLTQISTGFYTAHPSKPYIAFACIQACGLTDCFIGIEWYTSANALIRTDLGTDNPSADTLWHLLTGNFTSPSNAAKFKLTVQVQESNKGDVNHIDFCSVQQCNAQVLVDWVNNAFKVGGNAGTDFMDVSPWVRMDTNGITYTRGRQDAITEIQSGTASFDLQNDTGMFTRKNQNTIPILAGGGTVSIQARCQINLADENGVWYTRFDGPISEIDYTFDNTGNTSIASISVTDVLSFLSRQDSLSCWTKETVLADKPVFHWTLDDSGNAGGSGLAAETSGNNGPPLRPWNSDNSKAAAIAWQDSTGGVETLADAVNPVSTQDGSEYWSAGTNQPNSQIRGLDPGTVGPYSTPLGSIYLAPVLTATTAANYFVGNTGFQLQTLLPYEIDPSPSAASGSGDWAVEIWFTMDAAVKTHVANNFGPYIAVSLGSSRFANCLVAGLYGTGGSPMSFEVGTYNNPPSFLGKNYPGVAPPAQVASIVSNMVPDSVNIPHHLVINFAGDPTTPLVTAYLDGKPVGTGSNFSFPLNKKQVYDTIAVGGAFGGTGCWQGGLQLASIYDYQLSTTQINLHCQMGQYGMWETTTDNCIAQLAQFAKIPSYWNNLTASSNGLTLTDYQDITGSNALSAMEVFEQAELGVLYIDASGRLNFNTRDQRMGKGAPDLLLPPDTFDASMGYGVVDQFQINEQAVASQIFQTGGSYINQASQDKYGVYATNAVGAPLQLPIITWSRAYGQLGLTSFYYWADPNLDDYAAWLANSRAEPFMLPGTLTIDMLAPSLQGNKHISDYYKLDIGSLIAPTGTLPASFPDVNFSTEWFVEGVTETIKQDGRQIQFYTSPAEVQRAWKPGDATYGVLGSTTRVGISDADTSPVQADGKDVAHDAGPPYWPPVFNDGQMSWSFETGTMSWTGTNATLSQDTTVFFTDGLDSLKITSTGAGLFWQGASPAKPVIPGSLMSASADVFVPQALAAVRLVINWTDASDTFISASNGTSVAMAANTQTTVAVTGTAPAGAFNAHVVVQDNESVAAGKFMYTDNVQLMPGSLNNPANDGHNFVGAADLRGIADNLKLMLKPPMLAVSATSAIQSQANGSLAQPQIFWDVLHVDTVGGMGAAPGWPNWYVCLVPGFYEIDACLSWQLGTTAGGTAGLGWIVVAQQAAQALAAATANPVTVPTYVCPIGEQIRINAVSMNPISNPTVRLYLGLGDMITLAGEQNTGAARGTAVGVGGSHLSLRFCGYGRTDDRTQINGSINGGSVTQPKQTTFFTKTYNNTHSHSYNGSSASSPNTIRDTDGLAYQGTYSGGHSTRGSQYAQITLPYLTMQADLTVTGAVMDSATLKCTNQHTWYTSGGKLMVGSCFSTPGSSPWLIGSNSLNHTDIVTEAFDQGQTKTFTIPTSLIDSIRIGSGGTHMKAYLIGNNSTENLDFYGYWTGTPNSWITTVNYHVTV